MMFHNACPAEACRSSCDSLFRPTKGDSNDSIQCPYKVRPGSSNIMPRVDASASIRLGKQRNFGPFLSCPKALSSTLLLIKWEAPYCRTRLLFHLGFIGITARSEKSGVMDSPKLWPETLVAKVRPMIHHVLRATVPSCQTRQ